MRLVILATFLILSLYAQSAYSQGHRVTAKTYGCTLEGALQNVREMAISKCQSVCDSSLAISCTNIIVGTLGTCSLRRLYLHQIAIGDTKIDGKEVCFDANNVPTVPYPIRSICDCECSCDTLGLGKLSSILDNIVPKDNKPIIITDDLMATPIGTGKLVDERIEMPKIPFEMRTTDGSTETDETDLPRRTKLIAFNSGTKVEWEIEVGSNLFEKINRLRDGLTGVEKIHTIPSYENNVPTKRGWSNADDSRILREPTTQWPWRTISDFGRCTGTLIGPRHVLTAAHCINAQGTNNWFTVTVIPGRNENSRINEPYGQSTITLNAEPGDPFRWYFTPVEWRNPLVTEYSPNFDWGILVLPDRIGELTGWMGYVAKPALSLAGLYHYNRGYPACDKLNAPSPSCVDGALYGDTKSCQLNNYSFRVNGWNRLVRTNCDISGGHSGSPLYHYHGSNSVPVVAAIVVAEFCEICTASDDFINVAKRLTPSDISTISFFRQWQP